MPLDRFLASHSSARRDALRRLAATPLAGWLGVAGAQGDEVAGAEVRLASPAVADTLTRFLDTLIPADALSPAASGAGVPARILAAAAGHALYARLVVLGCGWLDRQANGRFAALPEPEAVRLLEWIETLPDDALPRRFMEIVRDDAMYHYYSEPASWGGLAVTGPPQPVGYTLD